MKWQSEEEGNPYNMKPMDGRVLRTKCQNCWPLTEAETWDK